VPLYAVLIGLEIDGVIEVGVVYFPALDEMVYAASGLGCFWNGRPARVRPTKMLRQAVVSFTDPASFEKFSREETWKRIKHRTYYRVGWSDAYGYALVATGRIEIMLDPIMAPWDAAPFPVILREAGGYFGDWSGVETIYGGEGLSTTNELLPKVLQLIEGD
jgi:myo-inositol-1(or 4)-monophosphatase